MTKDPTPPARKIRALIVDDEPPAADAIRHALAAFDDVEVVGTCGDGDAAVAAIRELRPDLVFLDIQMPGLDGFGVVEEIGPQAMPEVVFVTAYDEYALRAFEVHAVDYLLKPFDDRRFGDCMAHAVERLGARQAGRAAGALGALLEDVPGGLRVAAGAGGASGYATRLLVRERDRLHFVEVSRIDYIEAAGNYIRIHDGKRSHLIRTTLAEAETRLDPRDFMRIHRSTIVNMGRIRELQPWAGGDYVAILDDGRQLRVSRTYRDSLLRTYA